MINRTKRAFFLVLLSSLILTVSPHFFGITGLSGLASSQKPGSGKKVNIPVAPGRVIVKFKKGAFKNFGLKTIKHFRLFDAYVYEVPAGETAKSLVKKLSSDASVKYAELDYKQFVLSTVPNDALFDQLWGLHNTGQTGGTAGADIHAPEAWDYTTGSSNVVVAVIDTGVDYKHPDLAANIWTNPGEIPGDGIDNDGNGYIDDVHGINAITGSGDPMDDNSHGTHVSGTIGAEGNNGIGVTGVCWNVKIMGLKFLDSGGSGYTSDAISCIEYAIDKGANVMSNSWGGGGYSQALKDAIEAAKNSGILFIAAAGNAGSDNDALPSYPASYDNDNIIAVAATDHNDRLAGFSSYGLNSVDVAAPGVNILSTIPGGGYDSYSGTSMATPYVSGLAALLMSYNPTWTWDKIKSRILAGSEPLADLNGLILTGGRISAYNSLFVNLDTPHIYSLDPSSCVVGTPVKILGFSFGSSQGAGYVEFAGNIQATINSWSDGKIECIVPEGAQTGEVKVYDANSVSSNGFPFRIQTPYYHESLISNEFQGGGTALGFKVDDGIVDYALPFGFNFFGTTYPAGTIIHICSNGYIDFASTAADYANAPQKLKNNVRIAPLWMDLLTNGTAQAGEDVYIARTANSLKIRWVAETFLYAEPMDFELILSADGRIKFNYGPGNANFHSYWSTGPTIGVSCGQCDYFYDLSQYDNATNLSMVETDLYTPGSMPTIQVTSPGAGSVWLKKSVQQIIWTKLGTQDPNVKIQLWRGGKKIRDIATSAANNGSFNWAVGGNLTPASNYFVRITTLDNLVRDDSPLFRITDPTFIVTAPDPSTVWMRGSTQAIIWTKLGTQSKKVNIVLRRNGVKLRDLAIGTADDGSFDRKIPANLKAQSGYINRVKTPDGKYWGESAPFALN
jgi:hypothetical protein